MESSARGRIPRPTQGVDLSAVRLTAEEGFVWSRVDGTLSVEEICDVTGLGPERTMEILERLHDLGLIDLPGHEADSKAVAQGHEAYPKAAAQELESPGRGSPRQANGAASDAASGGQGAPDSGMLQSLDGFSPDSSLDISEELQREIAAFHASLDRLNFYQVLGVSQSADRKGILRAYKKRSLRYHPDRYYGKRLGKYEKLLEDIFQHLTKVRDFLLDEAKRKQYDESLAEDQRLKRDMESAMALEEEVVSALQEQVDMEGVAFDGPDHTSGRSSSARGPADRPPRRRLSGYRRRPSRLRLKALASVLGVADEPAAEPQGSGTRDPERLARRRTARLKELAARMSRSKEKAAKFYEEGIRKLLDGNFIGASTSLKLALTLDPENEEYAAKYKVASGRAKEIVGESYYKQGRFQESVGRWETAAKLYTQAADHNPIPEYLRRAAEALLHTGDMRQAKQYAEQAVRAGPQDVQARLVLAKVYAQARLYKNAKRELDQVLELDSGNEDAKILLKEIRKHL